MFHFLKNKKEDITPIIETNASPALETQSISPDQKPVPELKPEDPIPFDENIQMVLNGKIIYIFSLSNNNNNRPHKGVLSFDKKTKHRWEKTENVGLQTESFYTQEEYWLAYINAYNKNIIEKADKSFLTDIKKTEMREAQIEKIAKLMDDSSRFISDVRDKIKNINDAQREINNTQRENVESRRSPILRDQVFVISGTQYKVTSKQKKVLIELEKTAGWTTANSLTGVGESETYICDTLRSLMNRGFPITSHLASGKRFWAFIHNKSNDGDNKDIAKQNPNLIIHALHLYNYLNGRPPSTSDVAAQLKWDVTVVKNELYRLESNGLVKSEKTLIDGKKIKVWRPADATKEVGK